MQPLAICPRRRLIAVALAASILAATSTNAIAQERPVTVRIEVVSDDGPVEGATVVAGAVTATTDATGRAQVAVPSGLLRLTVSKEDFVDVTTDLTLVAGEDAAVDQASSDGASMPLMSFRFSSAMSVRS